VLELAVLADDLTAACHLQTPAGISRHGRVFGGEDVPCVPYSTFGSAQLAQDVADALRTRTACLMGNHGATARGRNLATAIQLAHRPETSCRHYVLACGMGRIPRADGRLRLRNIGRAYCAPSASAPRRRRGRAVAAAFVESRTTSPGVGARSAMVSGRNVEM